MLFFKFDSLIIEAMRNIDDINHPGKFEGEPSYSPYFYHLWLHGCGSDTLYPVCEHCKLSDGDCDGCNISGIEVFDIDHVDRRLFPELRGIKQVSLFESDSGFVYCEPYNP